MNQRYDIKLFFHYVIPSVLSFALSGVYSIVDGFFVGNSVGDLGLSTINIAYPIVALIQSFGTGIGMGGAICYAIRKAEKKEGKAREFSAGALWILLLSGFLLTVGILLLNRPLLRVLGAKGVLLSLGEEYISIIALGAGLQILGTGLVPFIRNHGGSFYAMASMIAGFAANILLDYLFVWVFQQGVAGAALATVIGQGITMLAALAYLLYKKQLTLRIPYSCMGSVSASIFKTGIAPFGLAMAPNITLTLSQPLLYLIRRGKGNCRLCLYRIYDLYPVPDFTRCGGWKPAFNEPVLWGREFHTAGKSTEPGICCFYAAVCSGMHRFVYCKREPGAFIWRIQ